MRRVAFVVAGFLALAGVIGFVATNEFDGAGSRQEASAPQEGAYRDAGGEAAGAGAVTDEASGDDRLAAPQPLAVLGSSVIRTGTLALEVGRGEFEEAFDAASLVASHYGGFVQSSSMSGTEERSGELVLRVPADRFDEAISDLRALGTVERSGVQAEDVTAEFVDLEARLLTWQAQEAVLLDLMAQTTSIAETIRVQSELQDVRYRIEQIQGQLRVLEDRTALATIRVALREPGAPVVGPAAAERPSLAEAWTRAIDGFVGVWYAVVVGLGYLVPVTLLAGVAWLGYRRLASRAAPAP